MVNISSPDNPANPDILSHHIHTYDNPELASLMNIYIHSYDNPDNPTFKVTIV